MPELKLHTHVKDFLKTSENFLLENEANNNHILGNCNAIILQNRSCDDCYFLTVWDNDKIDACSIKVSSKIILSAGSREAIEEIYRCYKDNNIPFKGVIGNKNAVEIFLQLHKPKISQNRKTLVQQLDKLHEFTLTEGAFEVSKLSDVPTLTKWMVQFFNDEKLKPAKTPDEIEGFLKGLISEGNLFSWVKEGKVVSVAGIVRKTKNTAVIGLVYTPEDLRGKGYAGSITYKLSEWILNKGFSKSVLLVFDANTTAKSIYGKIGYETVSELLDVDFE